MNTRYAGRSLAAVMCIALIASFFYRLVSVEGTTFDDPGSWMVAIALFFSLIAMINWGVALFLFGAFVAALHLRLDISYAMPVQIQEIRDNINTEGLLVLIGVAFVTWLVLGPIYQWSLPHAQRASRQHDYRPRPY